MSLKIRKAAVLGAGVMGAQIAAHLAAAGVRVHLLDLPGKDAPKDKKLAKAVGKNVRAAPSIIAMEHMKKLKPSPLMTEEVLNNIVPGNFEDDMSVLSTVDWVIEAVVERMDIKKKIHKQISENVKNTAIITTNTSGISINEMAKHFPDHLKDRFFGIHFFNPPRYLHLVEVIPHVNSNKDLMTSLGDWISERLGKGIVHAYDTTNFIANRIGVYNMQITIKHMSELGLNIETVDALTGKLMGRPSSATFRTADVVGLDTLAHTSTNVFNAAKDDPEKDVFLPADWLSALIEKGSLGAKSGSKGCYLKTKDAKGKTAIKVFRPEKNDYEDQNPSQFAWLKAASKEPNTFHRLAAVFGETDEGAQLVWRTLRDTFAYAASRCEEIAGGDVKAIDEAIKWGFNWQYGPFELWQGIGFQKILSRMQEEGVSLPSWITESTTFYNPVPGSEEWELRGAENSLNSSAGKNQPVVKQPHIYRLPKRQTSNDDRVIESNGSASLLDLGDKCACLSFHTKMNTIDDGIMDMLQTSLERVDHEFDALIVANEGEHYSAGANLKMIMEMIGKKDFDGIDKLLRRFQGLMQMMKYSHFPVVTAPHGMTFGGGCEVSLHGDAQILAAETYAGLVEIGVGLVPAGGGTKELAVRAYDMASKGTKTDPMSFLQTAFELIGMAKVSTSGAEAVKLGLYPATAQVSLSKTHLIDRAKRQALSMAANGYAPPSAGKTYKVPGDPGMQTFKLALYNMTEGGFISEYDSFIAERIAKILCGGDIDGGQSIREEDFLALERDVFVELCGQEKTQQRIMHMLEKGKPLRN